MIRYTMWGFCLSLLLSGSVFCEKRGNPANDFVDLINANRTSRNLPKLSDSPGLGCIALQYAKQCINNCTINGTAQCRPSDEDFVEVFGPNCGVELPTMDAISGRIIGCASSRPSFAFSSIVEENLKSLRVLRNITHTQVGVGMMRSHRKGRFVWCALFGSGRRVNSTFVLGDLGEGVKQNEGCFSGLGAACGAANRKAGMFLWKVVFIVMYCLMV